MILIDYLALAESLRHELLFYGIGVHCHFPGNIDSPGYILENTTKPAFTRELDGDSVAKSPEEVANNLVRGVEQGHIFITNEFESQMFRALGSGEKKCCISIIIMIIN
jgi:3-dehydrosphinganine reductase